MKPWRAWVELWDRREPPTALALVRILVGACVLADLLYVVPGIVDAGPWREEHRRDKRFGALTQISPELTRWQRRDCLSGGGYSRRHCQTS